MNHLMAIMVGHFITKIDMDHVDGAFSKQVFNLYIQK